MTAASPEEALALLDVVEGVDVLFSEIKLNGEELAGVRLAKQAARRRPGMKVVYAAEHVTDGLRPLLAAPAAVLEKPYGVGDLKNALAA